MEAIQKYQNIARESIGCTCEKTNFSKKNTIFTICDICSEQKFSKKTSKALLRSDSSSFGD